MAQLHVATDKSIPVQRIISVACRNFMAFDGLHTFEFDSGVNTIIGGNSSGKSSLITLISQALSRSFSQTWAGRWNRNFDTNESLIEMKFIAGDKEHYLRRVLLGSTTTDLHLYIDDEGEQTFMRDGEVMRYLRSLKPISTIEGFEHTRDDFYFWTNGKTATVNPIFSKSKTVIDGVNKFLPLAQTGIVKIRVIEDDVMAQYRNGELKHLTSLSSGDANIIFVIAKIFNVLARIENENASKVILVDELEFGLDTNKLKTIYAAISEIADELDCQFMITSRYARGRKNPIRLDKAKIPDWYIENKTTNLQQMIRKHIGKMNSGSNFTSPSSGKKITNNFFKKIRYNKGSFKWKP